MFRLYIYEKKKGTKRLLRGTPQTIALLSDLALFILTH